MCTSSISMSGKGNCSDNAMVETFFKTLKAELVWAHHLPEPDRSGDRNRPLHRRLLQSQSAAIRRSTSSARFQPRRAGSVKSKTLSTYAGQVQSAGAPSVRGSRAGARGRATMPASGAQPRPNCSTCRIPDDDWGLEPLDAAARHDLLEILEERYGRRSTVITSQLPIDRWHEIIGDPTYADAILDRFIHNAHRIELAGESLRRTQAKQSRKA